MQGCLYQYLKKEASVTRRIDIWFFGSSDGKEDADDQKHEVSGENKFVVHYIVTSFKQILKEV